MIKSFISVLVIYVTMADVCTPKHLLYLIIIDVAAGRIHNLIHSPHKLL